MVDEGIIWGLSTLALRDDSKKKTLVQLCAKALCNLSCDYARDMLNSFVAINAIMKLIMMDNDVEMQRDGGRALTNLLLQTTDADEEFRCRSVQAIPPMAKSKDEEVSEMCILCLCLASQSESCREDIVNSEMLTMIDATTIFTKPLVSYAYLTMFGNIANNPSMRTRLLDEHSMQRFTHICKSNDPYLDMAVAKALYCISCAPENIPKLAEQNILPIVSTIWAAPYEKGLELTHHLVAFLYNMTTSKSVQSKLVSQGIVKVFSDLWPTAIQDARTCRLTCLAVCQLGCGNVNSSQMVSDGCTTIMCFVTSHRHDKAKYGHYAFPTDLNERCAAALRNLLCVIPNQNIMVQHGVIKTLVELALPEREFMPEPAKSIRQNCASALRSMTYNDDMRHELKDSGAISIILSDLKLDADEEDVTIGANLLKELEAESWSNGSRGRQKEGRALPIDPAPLYQDLLGGSPNVVLDVKTSYSPLEKLKVHIQLEEPPIEAAGTIQGIEHDLRDLTSYNDMEDTFAPPMQSQPKQECDIREQPMRRRSFVDVVEQVRSVAHDHDLLEEVLPLDDNLMHRGDGELISDDDFEGILDGSDRMNESFPCISPNASANNLGMESNNKQSNSTKRQKEKEKEKNAKSVVFADLDQLPPVPSADLSKKAMKNVTRKISHIRGAPELPRVLQSTSGSKSNKEEDFKGLVAFINHSKDKGTQIDSVVEKWALMSRY